MVNLTKKLNIYTFLKEVAILMMAFYPQRLFCRHHSHVFTLPQLLLLELLSLDLFVNLSNVLFKFNHALILYLIFMLHNITSF